MSQEWIYLEKRVKWDGLKVWIRVPHNPLRLYSYLRSVFLFTKYAGVIVDLASIIESVGVKVAVITTNPFVDGL
jgi:hypothetical protein